MTIGAGQQFAEIYKYAEDNGFTVAGGTSSTVGMSGGWIAGGGHSAVSGAIGLGTDNVLEFKVVTPKSSEVIVASRCQNQDVFFALAGGGHNTVGVVLESTHNTHPVMPLQVASIAILTPNAEAAQKLMELSASRALEFTNRGWGGYLALTPRVGEVSAVLMVNWKLDTAEATKDMQPIIDFVASLPKENVLINGVFPVKSFYEAFSKYFIRETGETVPVGMASTAGSRLLTDELWEPAALNKTVQSLQDYMMALNPLPTEEAYGALVLLCLTSPYKLPADGLTAEPKAWRNTVIHAFGGVAWSTLSTLKYKKSRLDALDQAVEILRRLKPDGQAYFNEAYYDEPKWESTFWDRNTYDRLVKIKAKYDPSKLLNCWKCIGWKGPSDPKYKCYP